MVVRAPGALEKTVRRYLQITLSTRFRQRIFTSRFSFPSVPPLYF